MVADFIHCPRDAGAPLVVCCFLTLIRCTPDCAVMGGFALRLAGGTHQLWDIIDQERRYAPSFSVESRPR